MSLLTQTKNESTKFQVPKMVGFNGDDSSLVKVISLMRDSEVMAFKEKARKHGKAPMFIPTTNYERDGVLCWNADFRTMVPKGVQLIRDNELDLIPIPVIKGG